MTAIYNYMFFVSILDFSYKDKNTRIKRSNRKPHAVYIDYQHFPIMLIFNIFC